MGFDGFDGVEFVMSLEDRLGLAIPDRDAEQLQTPGDVVRYLSTRLNVAAPTLDVPCRSAAAFRRGRRRLEREFDPGAGMIRPSTPIMAIAPDIADRARRRAAWSRLSRALDSKLPGLRLRPIYFYSLGLALIPVAIAQIIAQSGPATIVSGTTVASLLVASIAIVTMLLLGKARRRFATELPEGFTTVGDVTSWACVHSIPDAPASDTGWTAQELWELTRDLTAQSAGLPPARIRRDVHFMSL